MTDGKKMLVINKDYHKAYNKAYYIKNSDKIKKRTRDWVKANPDKKKKMDKDYALKYPEVGRKAKDKWLSNNPIKRKHAAINWYKKNKYGISEDEFKNMLRLRNNKCDCCGNEETLTKKGIVQRLQIDHCHETGIVRGLLCNRCNSLAGSKSTHIQHLNKVINYLVKHYDRYKGNK